MQWCTRSLATIPRGGASESALLTKFTKYGDELRLCSDALVLAGECTFEEIRDAAFGDELRGHRCLPCAGVYRAAYFF